MNNLKVKSLLAATSGRRTKHSPGAKLRPQDDCLVFLEFSHCTTLFLDCVSMQVQALLSLCKAAHRHKYLPTGTGDFAYWSKAYMHSPARRVVLIMALK